MLVSSNQRVSTTRDDLEFAKHLGRSAAIAVDNARLYRAAEERARARRRRPARRRRRPARRSEAGSSGSGTRRAEQITGLATADTVGRSTAEIFSPWDTIADLAKPGEPRPQAQPVEINGRELWLSITGVAFEGGTVFAFRDLTAERAVGKKLKSDFVSTVSHELRTPLAAIYGAALDAPPRGRPRSASRSAAACLR